MINTKYNLQWFTLYLLAQRIIYVVIYTRLDTQLKVSERTAGVEYAIRDTITHARAYEKKNGKNVIYLNIGDPVQYDFPTPDHIKNALIKTVQSNENFYTASEGLPELRQAIVEKRKEKALELKMGFCALCLAHQY